LYNQPRVVILFVADGFTANYLATARVKEKGALVLKPSDIADILKIIDSSDFQEMRLQLGDMKFELRRGAPLVPAPEATTPAAIVASPAEKPIETQYTPSDGSTPVPAPMLGVFWHAPRPGDPPFVKVGDQVRPDSLIGIIEVMKLMNTVVAGVSGTVTAVVAANGKGVEFGQALIHVRTD
jgi:acetyl-CoA carboxylase biotin carboxyl carrier protein